MHDLAEQLKHKVCTVEREDKSLDEANRATGCVRCTYHVREWRDRRLNYIADRSGIRINTLLVHIPKRSRSLLAYRPGHMPYREWNRRRHQIRASVCFDQ